MVPAFASARTSPSATFFHGGAGSATWSTATSTGDGHSVELSVPDSSSYAGLAFQHIGTEVPATAPSFSFTEIGTPSGGSPRLVIAGANGCDAVEYAVLPYADGWNDATRWDLMNGSCGYQYNVDWSTVQSAIDSVASAYVVDDTYTGGHTDYVDDINYNGFTLSQPKDNANH